MIATKPLLILHAPLLPLQKKKIILYASGIVLNTGKLKKKKQNMILAIEEDHIMTGISRLPDI